MEMLMFWAGFKVLSLNMSAQCPAQIKATEKGKEKEKKERDKKIN